MSSFDFSLNSSPVFDENYAALYPKGVVHELRLLAQVFEHSALAVIITDTEPRIVKVNRAFVELTGFSEMEACGRNPSFLRGDAVRDQEFYIAMWDELMRTDKWAGELVNLRADGSHYPQHMTISAVRSDEGEVTHYIGQFYDITQRKLSEERIERLAHFDTVTGLPNRALLHDRAKMALTTAKRQQQRVGLLFIDLDGFKHINDSYGHDAGDQLLVEMGDRLTRSVRVSDTVARQGGDEFVVLLANIAGPKDAAQVADTIVKRLARPFNLGGREVGVTASVGIAVYPEDGHTFDLLQRHADAAMYEAKADGKNRYVYFAREMNDRNEARLTLEHDIRRGLRQREFDLFWQPQIILATGELGGLEAHLGWQHARSGVAEAEAFLPAAEASGLLVSVYEGMLLAVCQQMRLWAEQRVAQVPASLAVPTMALSAPGLIDAIKRLVAEYRVPPGMLELSVTESALMGGGELPLVALDELSRYGIRFALTGFGGADAGIPFLRRLPFRRLRIERKYIDELHTETGVGMVTALIALCHMLGVQALAEGVDTDLKLTMLRNLNCAEGVGTALQIPASCGLPTDEPLISPWPQPQLITALAA